MLRDVQWFTANGTDGIVSGVLDIHGRIDLASNLDLVHDAQGKCVFHRAFDFMHASVADLEQLIQIGFERVLTSGGALTARQGATRIAELIRHARGRIEILPGGGINPENVAELIRATGCTQVHGSFRSAVTDRTLNANPDLAAQMGPGDDHGCGNRAEDARGGRQWPSAPPARTMTQPCLPETADEPRATTARHLPR